VADLFLADVAVVEFDLKAGAKVVFGDVLKKRSPDRHGAVTSARAADGNGQVAAPIGLEARNPAPEELLQVRIEDGDLSAPVDTLGAGDIFHGAFCHFILQESWEDALGKAAEVASHSCRYFGTREWMKTGV